MLIKIYFQVIAALYLLMVVGMVGMNYRLKHRTRRVGLREEDAEGAEKEIKSSEIRFTEGGALSSRVTDGKNDNMPQKQNMVNL